MIGMNLSSSDTFSYEPAAEVLQVGKYFLMQRTNRNYREVTRALGGVGLAVRTTTRQRARNSLVLTVSKEAGPVRRRGVLAAASNHPVW